MRHETLTELDETLRERENMYGNFSEFAHSLAAVWSELLAADIRPMDIPLMMIAFKMQRGYGSKDTLMDIAGYAVHAADMMETMKHGKDTHTKLQPVR